MGKVVDFGGNDYLGLAKDPRLARAVGDTALRHGVSTSAGRWSIGWSGLHQELENQLREFFGTEDACIQGSAYLCGPAYFAAMRLMYDTVVFDEYCHTNLLLGMRGAEMRMFPFRHRSPESLERVLKDVGGHTIIATDGVYGISGSVAPLGDVIELAEEFNCDVLVDDSHGVFCVGADGGGALELCGKHPGGRVTLMGSMSKALGAYGGFMVGGGRIIEKVRRAPNYVGSTPMPYPIVGGCLEALKIVDNEPDLRERLRQNARLLRGEIIRAGIAVVSDDRVPVITLDMPTADDAVRLAETMCAQGLRLKYFTYPSEPRHNLLRAIARSCHELEDIQRFGQALRTFLGGAVSAEEG